MLIPCQGVVAQGSGLQLKSVGAQAGSSWLTQFQSGQHRNYFWDFFIFRSPLDNYLKLNPLATLVSLINLHYFD
jgi:hypothetical protein